MEPKSRCAEETSARESSEVDNPADSGRAIYRNQSVSQARLLSRWSWPARNTLPHPDTDRGRVSRSASTAPEGPCHSKRKATEQSKEHLLRGGANASRGLAQSKTRLFGLGRGLPVCPCLLLYDVRPSLRTDGVSVRAIQKRRTRGRRVKT